MNLATPRMRLRAALRDDQSTYSITPPSTRLDAVWLLRLAINQKEGVDCAIIPSTYYHLVILVPLIPCRQPESHTVPSRQWELGSGACGQSGTV